MKKNWALNYLLSAQWTLIRLGGCILLVLTWAAHFGCIFVSSQGFFHLNLKCFCDETLLEFENLYAHDASQAIMCTYNNIGTQCEPRHDKTSKTSMRPAKTQISLGIHPVWSESSLSAWRKLGSLAIHWAHSEDSDQTGRMSRLIWVFAGCTCTLLVL